MNVRIGGRLVVAMTALGLVLATTALAGCSRQSGGATGPTALDNLPIARSALSKKAPDAKLLLVRLAMDTVPGQPEAWSYFFGSPSTDKGYLVRVTNGTSMGVQDTGPVGLSTSAWSTVPGTEAWKIDSDVAYKSALGVSGLKAAPAAYMMGLETYKSVNDTSTVEPFVWRVLLYPVAGSGETTVHVDVNATTGAASVRKVTSD